MTREGTMGFEGLIQLIDRVKPSYSTQMCHLFLY